MHLSLGCALFLRSFYIEFREEPNRVVEAPLSRRRVISQGKVKAIIRRYLHKKYSAEVKRIEPITGIM
jgi:hypothetical protein